MPLGGGDPASESVGASADSGADSGTDASSEGGFGGLGIGNPGSYGGEASVGAPGFSGDYSGGGTEATGGWESVVHDQRVGVPGAAGYTIGPLGYNTGEMTRADMAGYGLVDRAKIAYGIVADDPGMQLFSKAFSTLGKIGKLTKNPALMGGATLGKTALAAVKGLGMIAGLVGTHGEGFSATGKAPSDGGGAASLASRIASSNRQAQLTEKQLTKPSSIDYAAVYDQVPISATKDVRTITLSHLQNQDSIMQAAINALDKWRRPVEGY